MDNNVYIGQQIGNYRLTEAIASGGFGSVYKAEHIHLSGRLVAIKILHPYLGSQTERDQFTQEARFLAQLEHPSILPLLDFGFSNGQPYLITHYAAGGSLRQKLKQQKHLPLPQVLAILQQVGNALHFAHQRNIIHRDLKPENLLFNERDEALLADFGIAVMLSTASVQHLSVITGTPPYMAPEQFQGTISKEGDQYALGCIAYELLTGQPPFRAPDFVSMGFKHLTELPIPPRQFDMQIPLPIEAAILKALAKQRSERHADIPAFLAAMREPFTQPTFLPIPAPSAPQPALGNITPTVQAGPWTSEQWLEQGDTYFTEQRYEEALAAYEQALLLDPNNTLAYDNKGGILAHLQRYEEALDAYEQAIVLNPHFAQAYQSKGLVLHYLQRYEEALTAFEQTISLNPNDAYAYCNKGITLHHLQRYEEALIAYEQALFRYPNLAAAYYHKGVSLEQLQRYKEALDAYEQAISLDPDDAAAYLGKGYTLAKLQRYEETLAACEQAISLDPSFANAYLGRGYALISLQRNEEALDACEQAISLDPILTEAYVGKGASLINLQRYEEALDACKQALRLDPNFADAYIVKGHVLKVLGRKKEARAAYARARKLGG